MSPLNRVELGSPGLRSALEEALGGLSLVSPSGMERQEPAAGRLVSLVGSQPLIRLNQPGFPEDPLTQVMVSIPHVGLVFESQLLDRPDPGALLLTYPLWLSVPERRAARRVDVQLPCRLALTGSRHVHWQSAVVTNMSVTGLSLFGPVSVTPSTPLLVRVPVPGQPIPLLLQVTCLWCNPKGEGFQIGGQFSDLSIQAERSLAGALKKMAPESVSPEGGADLAV